MHRLMRIDGFSAGKIVGAGYALFGLVVSVIFAGGLFLDFAGLGEMWPGVRLGLVWILALPLLYGVLGFLAGLLGAFVFNVGARLVGGLEIDLVEERQA